MGVIGTDLAEAVPEVVDKTTYVIKIRPNVFFHDTERIRGQFPEVAGRQLTAEDVRYSIERQKNTQSPKSALSTAATSGKRSIRSSGADPALTITTKVGCPFMHYLADTYAAIVPKELVDPESDDMNSFDKMIGTGPFMLEKFVTLQVVKCLRNPNWFAKDDLADQGLPDRPIVDGYEALWGPADQLSTEAAFRKKQVDSCEFYDKSLVEPVTQEIGAEYDKKYESGVIASRLLINDSPAAKSPFKDIRLRQAINIAVDRSRLGQVFYRGLFNLGSPVTQAVRKWALPLDELTQRPGYRFRREERSRTRGRQGDVGGARRLDRLGGMLVRRHPGFPEESLPGVPEDAGRYVGPGRKGPA
jgi:ABC-type transport system substrate-binding protein